MHPYSHLVFAKKLETFIQPENPKEYYWGAVAPDIRYISALQRHTTHLPPNTIIELIGQYPHLESFLQGYLVHCLVDDVPLREIFFARFPLSFMKGRLSRQQISAVMEMYYFKSTRLSMEISGDFNEILENMGVRKSDCAKFSQFIGPYIASPSQYDRITSLVAFLGLDNDPRIDKYLSAAKLLHQNKLLKTLLFTGIHVGKVTNRIIHQVVPTFNPVSTINSE